MNRALRSLSLLKHWAYDAERDWHPIPGHAGQGFYGTGYNAWGVQTNQKYLAALATLATLGEQIQGVDQQWALDRAMGALRFSLASHHTGSTTCTDGTAWGHTWISALGIERAMYGVQLLMPHFTDADHDALRRVLTSEADWIWEHHVRAGAKGVVGGLWAVEGKNVPESNLWNGALLWRSAVMYPDHPHADQWRERAHEFLINSVSVPADAEDETIVAGKPVRERFSGPNFFPNYALDHHNYLNVGYMVICVSNAAMLHFDLKSLAKERPETLDHHQGDLWRVLRRMVFGNGRLARIGGDSRLRYTYCQEYLLPSLMFAADHLDDPHALTLVDRQIEMIEQEAAHNGDGSFYGRRLSAMARHSPYYMTRLEADRACALGMVAAWEPLVSPTPPTQATFEASVAGGWEEPEHGAVLHRGPRRLASFAWRGYMLAQGLCLPPEEGHLADWQYNLAGRVRFIGDNDLDFAPHEFHRRLLRHDIASFPGGFLTWGALMEGVDLTVPEGWKGSDSAKHQIVFAALPDGRTMVGLEHCRAGDRRVLIADIKGMHLNLPNDLFNGFTRTLTGPAGEKQIQSPAPEEEVVNLGGNWANIERKLGVVGLYGADTLALHRLPQRQGGSFRSLYVDQLCWPCRIGPFHALPHQVILDAGWAAVSDADVIETQQVAQRAAALPIPGSPSVRVVRVTGLDGVLYWLTANFGDQPQRLASRLFLTGQAQVRDLTSGEVFRPASGGQLALEPGQARLLAGI